MRCSNVAASLFSVWNCISRFGLDGMAGKAIENEMRSVVILLQNRGSNDLEFGSQEEEMTKRTSFDNVAPYDNH